MQKSTLKLNTIIIILVISIILVIGIIFINSLNSFDKTIVFTLKGEETMTIYLSSNYQEPGYIATKNNVDLSSKVVVTGYVNTNAIGEYEITYSLLDDKGKEKTLKRTVNVKYIDGIKLNGPTEMYLLVGGSYQELGFVAYKDNIDVSSQVSITNQIDMNKEGDYRVRYSYDNYVVERIIHISNFSNYFKLEYNKEKTDKEITLSINVDEEKVSKYLLPNNEERKIDSTYTITDNGNYIFTIYDLYGNSYKQTITVDNIDKLALELSCHATITGNKTNVKTTANKKIVKYFYNNHETTNSSYSMTGRNANVVVKTIDEYGNSKEVKCSTEYYSQNLEIHFIASGHYDDAILIRTDDKTIFIDGGRANCADKVFAYLNDLGIKKIDALIGSHLQNDHIALQGIMLDRYTVDTLYYPDNIFTCPGRSCLSEDQQYIVAGLKKHNKTPIIVTAPRLIEIGEMKLYFIGPYSIINNPGNPNDNSLIFILKFRDNTFMFTGDSDSPLNDVNTLRSKASSLGISIDVDMLKYPHHGNKVLKNVFLQAITPKYVIVPNYNASQYPSSNNITSITNVGGKIYRQSDGKNIVLISDGKNININTNVNAINYKRSR